MATLQSVPTAFAIIAGDVAPPAGYLVDVVDRRPVFHESQQTPRPQGAMVAGAAVAWMVALTVIAYIYGGELGGVATLGYAGVFMVTLVASSAVVVPIPGVAVAFAASGIWNPALVALVGASGSAAGELVSYLTGVGSREAVHRLSSRHRWYTHVESWVGRRGTATVLLAAMLPVPFFDVIGFASGSLGLPIRRFIVACWVGRIVKFSGAALAGYWGANAVLGTVG